MQNQLQNPQMMMEMMQNPAVQSMMQALMNDPQRMEQLIAANPMFAGNPEMVRFRFYLHFDNFVFACRLEWLHSL